MKHSDLQELHYITPIANVKSIMSRGILCKTKASRLNPVSIALEEVQDTRAKKAVPGGLPLHSYANLYFCARNPMMFKRRGQHGDICVLKVSTEVLDLRDVVIADGNAASKYTAFWPSPSGLAKVNGEWVFAEYWTDQDQITYWRKASAKCSEVLVPDTVPARMVMGASVSCEDARQKLLDIGFARPIAVDAHLFFRG